MPAEQWTIRMLPSTYLDCGSDRELFLSAVSDFLANDFAQQVTRLVCNHDHGVRNNVHIEIKLRREQRDRNTVEAPLTDWLDEIALNCPDEVAAQHQMWQQNENLNKVPEEPVYWKPTTETTSAKIDDGSTETAGARNG